MNLRKRTLALLLTLCMLLSVVVPMASAAEKTISIQLGKDNGYSNDSFIATEFHATKSVITTYDDHFRVNFKTADSENGGWAAIRIPGSSVPTGTYTLAMTSPKAYSKTKDDLSKVYFLKDTSATGDALTSYITNGLKDSSTYCGEFNSSSTAKQNVGTVSTDGKDFILVFKCSANQSGNIYATVSNLYFTPAAEQGGGTVNPPAGGEGGSTVNPPVDTPPQTGDASPVLFAVMALAASLLAMVALIPGKKRA